MKKIVIVGEEKAIETACNLNASRLIARNSGLIEQWLVYEQEKNAREVYLDPILDMWEEAATGAWADGPLGVELLQAAVEGNEHCKKWVLDLIRPYCGERTEVTVIGVQSQLYQALRKLGAAEELGVEFLD